MLRILVFAAFGVAAGCATTPPPVVLLDEVDVAVDRAVSAGADDHAPVELRFARDKQQRARAAAEEGDGIAARRYAEQALVDAELAVAKARAGKFREQAARQRIDNAALADELGVRP